MTFSELFDCYLDQEETKNLKSYYTVKLYLGKFRAVFGDMRLGDIRLSVLQNLQEKRKKEGLKPKTIDDELNYAKTAVIKGIDNDLLGGDTLRTFRRVKRLLKGHAKR